MRPFVSPCCIRTELITVFPIRGRTAYYHKYLSRQLHKVFSLSTALFQLFSLHWPVAPCSCLIQFEKAFNNWYYSRLQKNILAVKPTVSGIAVEFWSTSLTFFHSSSLPLSFLTLPSPMPVVAISRKRRQAPAWMERFIIFSIAVQIALSLFTSDL